MAVPTHDATCKTRTFPIVCKFCNEDIFYFACNHGSEVLFDTLGSPWPKHFDRCIGHKIVTTQSSSKMSLAELEEIVKNESRSRGTFVPSNIQDIFRALKFRETGTPLIFPLTPCADGKEFTGTVIDFNRTVNVFKRLDVADTLLNRALLRPLLAHEHGLIHVRGEVNPKNGLCPQVDAFIRTSVLERAKITKRRRPRSIGW
jgi:hypothetical protein